jgi:RES domain-containing protein
MPAGWRIVPTRRAAAAFTGQGARLYGARWNSPGIALVYTSEHLSLAALEVLVHRHLHRWMWEYFAYRAEWDEELMQRLPSAALPPDWRGEPPADGLRALGDTWVRENRSAVLAVPSVIIPEEQSFLLNPAHPDFKQIRIGKPQPFVSDPRLVA